MMCKKKIYTACASYSPKRTHTSTLRQVSRVPNAASGSSRVQIRRHSRAHTQFAEVHGLKKEGLSRELDNALAKLINSLSDRLLTADSII